ncbi:hypothetical protein BaRGS_00013477 [Batillaria attramentaria]|uniref:Uncharacterized protein n=1 Tax=Batillaria attramentaria TaxID=370345 RepID=A0ABD0L800_9CAEN
MPLFLQHSLPPISCSSINPLSIRGQVSFYSGQIQKSAPILGVHSCLACRSFQGTPLARPEFCIVRSIIIVGPAGRDEEVIQSSHNAALRRSVYSRPPLFLSTTGTQVALCSGRAL